MKIIKSLKKNVKIDDYGHLLGLDVGHRELFLAMQNEVFKN